MGRRRNQKGNEKVIWTKWKENLGDATEAGHKGKVIALNT